MQRKTNKQKTTQFIETSFWGKKDANQKTNEATSLRYCKKNQPKIIPM